MKISTKALEIMLLKCWGNYTLVANTLKKEMGIELKRDTIKRRVERTPQLQEAAKAGRESMIDMAEAVVVKGLEKGDVKTALKMLEMLGSSRGYKKAEDVTVTGAVETSTPNVTVNFIEPKK